MRTSRTNVPPGVRRRASGFTLIELLIVLTIVALAAAVVAPALGTAVGFGRLRGETGTLVSGLREARAQAMTTGHSVDVVLDGAQWRIDDDSHRVAPGVGIAFDVPPAGEGAQGPFIRFFPDGRSTGGVIHVRRDDQTRTIQVDWITGHAHQTP